MFWSKLGIWSILVVIEIMHQMWNFCDFPYLRYKTDRHTYSAHNAALYRRVIEWVNGWEEEWCRSDCWETRNGVRRRFNNASHVSGAALGRRVIDCLGLLRTGKRPIMTSAGRRLVWKPKDSSSCSQPSDERSNHSFTQSINQSFILSFSGKSWNSPNGTKHVSPVCRLFSGMLRTWRVCFGDVLISVFTYCKLGVCKLRLSFRLRPSSVCPSVCPSHTRVLYRVAHKELEHALRRLRISSRTVLESTIAWSLQWRVVVLNEVQLFRITTRHCNDRSWSFPKLSDCLIYCLTTSSKD